MPWIITIFHMFRTKEGLLKLFSVSRASRLGQGDCIWSEAPPAEVYAAVPEHSLACGVIDSADDL